MFALLVSIRVKPNMEQEAQRVFEGPFRAAIAEQPGFQDAKYLQPDGGGECVLFIAFDDQRLQQQWVETALHTRVWAQMESNFKSYSVATYSAV